VLHAGHGKPDAFYFSDSSHDDCELACTEAGWGSGDLEWLVLDDCSCIADDRWQLDWVDAFQGLHLICGFSTTAHDVPKRGGQLADKLCGASRMTFEQAWFYACEATEAGRTTAAAVGAVPNEGGSPFDDRLPPPGESEAASGISPDVSTVTDRALVRVTHACD